MPYVLMALSFLVILLTTVALPEAWQKPAVVCAIWTLLGGIVWAGVRR